MEATLENLPHNKRLKATLALAAEQTEAAKSDDDLVAAIKLFEKFPSPVAYDNSTLNLTAGIIAATALIVAGVLYMLSNPPEHSVAAVGIAAFTGTVYAAMRYGRRASLSGLSDRIYYRSILFDHNIRAIRVNAVQQAKKLARQFGAFRHGNHKRLIEEWLEGKHDGEDNSFSYHYFHFHYVDKRTVTRTDSKGRTRTETVYDHFHRYGFIIPFGYMRDLHIAESFLKLFQGSYKTSSISFNKKFSVNPGDEFETVKFLKPAVIQEIEAAGDALHDVALEFNHAGDLCFSFGDRDTLRVNRKHGLKQPKEFAAEIAGKANQPKLIAALKFMENLIKYSDNNFAK